MSTAKAIRWFTDSPDAGEGGCVCSYCGERIEERDPELEEWEEDDSGAPIRAWKKNDAGDIIGEARFHDRCFNEVLQLGLLEIK